MCVTKLAHLQSSFMKIPEEHPPPLPFLSRFVRLFSSILQDSKYYTFSRYRDFFINQLAIPSNCRPYIRAIMARMIYLILPRTKTQAKFIIFSTFVPRYVACFSFWKQITSSAIEIILAKVVCIRFQTFWYLLRSTVYIVNTPTRPR